MLSCPRADRPTEPAPLSQPSASRTVGLFDWLNQLDTEAERSADLRILDETITKLRHRMAIASDDDGDWDRQAALLLKYLDRRAALLGLDRKPGATPRDGTIAGVTRKLELVGSPEKKKRK